MLKAAIAHLWFVTIHPFEDGNGRIGRAIADMALARSEKTKQRFYSMSAQIRREQNKYYGHLEDTQKGDLDITSHLEWFIGCLDRAFDGTETILAAVMKKAHFWKARIDESFNGRQRIVINRLLDGFEGKLTSSKWAKLAKCSQDTAGRIFSNMPILECSSFKHPRISFCVDVRIALISRPLRQNQKAMVGGCSDLISEVARSECPDQPYT